MALLTGFILSVTACEDDATFSITPSLGFMEPAGTVAQDKTIDIWFYSNVKLESPATVTVHIGGISDLVYGEDYTTEPAAVDGVITVTTDAETGKGKFTVITELTGELQTKKVNFKISSVDGGGVQPAQAVALNYSLEVKGFRIITPFNQTFTFDTGTAGFTERMASTGLQETTWGNYQGSAEANGYAKTGTTEVNGYLIITDGLPPADYSVSAKVYSQFAGAGQIKFRWSNTYKGTGDPEAAGVVWNDIAAINSALPAAASRAWKDVSGKFESPTNDKVYIAVQYVGAKKGNASSWRVDDLKISNQE